MEFKDSTQIEEYIWEGFRNAESGGLSKSRQSANNVNVEEEVQRDFVNEETSERARLTFNQLINNNHIKE